MVEVRLKPTPILLGFSFDLQEHKSHNNAALVMDHSSETTVAMEIDGPTNGRTDMGRC